MQTTQKERISQHSMSFQSKNRTQNPAKPLKIRCKSIFFCYQGARKRNALQKCGREPAGLLMCAGGSHGEHRGADTPVPGDLPAANTRYFLHVSIAFTYMLTHAHIHTASPCIPPLHHQHTFGRIALLDANVLDARVIVIAQIVKAQGILLRVDQL